MCKPASFVVTKNQVYWSMTTDGHLDIIKEFDIHVDGARGPNAVSVEICPPNDDYALPLSKWIFATDQDRLPSWYDAKKAEIRTRTELKKWAKAKIIKSGTRHIKTGVVLFVCGKAVVTVSGNGIVKSVAGNGIVEYVSDNGTVKSVYDNGKVESVAGNGIVKSVSGNGTVKSVSGNGTVKSVYGNGTVESVYGNGTVESVYGKGTVKSVYDNGTVKYVHDNGTVKSVSGNGTVEYVSGNGTVKSVYDNGTVIVYKVKVIDPTILKSTTAVMIDRHIKGKAVCYTGKDRKKKAETE